MQARADHRTLDAGETLNWYRIERVLGRGGFGVIYLATDTNLDHPVAIKEYLPPGLARRADDTTVEPLSRTHDELYRWGLDRFIREARNLVRFKHPNIVRVMSVFQQNNTAYMVMEFEAGKTLVRHLERPGNATETRLRALAGALADGLEEVHRHGFIHRDVKPANVLIRPDGSPVLLDFGSARASATGGGAMTALVSAGYAPLEQYDDGDEEQQGPWSDIYALGGLLHYAISGTDPVDSARRGAALLNGARDPLIPATTLGAGRYSRGFLAAIDWALEHRIADRPQTLSDWRPALLGDAVAVDADARRQSLRTPRPEPVTARRVRRFEDRDDFGASVPAADRRAGRTHRSSTSRRVSRTARAAHRDREAVESGGISRTRAVIATSILLGGIGVLWFASEQSSESANAARERAAAQARALNDSSDAPVEEALVSIGLPPSPRVAPGNPSIEEEAPEVHAPGAQARAEARTRSDAEATRLLAEQAEARAAAEQEAEQEAERRRAEAEALRTRTARLAEQAATRRAATLDARYESALSAASAALGAGRPELARDALADARATSRSDERLEALAARLAAAREERTRPVTDEQFESVVRRFDGLKRAIEARDTAVIDALTVRSDQNALFTQLMKGFESLNMEITGIRVRNADKSVTANLRIRDMMRANGDRAVPSPAYRDRDITSRLVEGEWSRITW